MSLTFHQNVKDIHSTERVKNPGLRESFQQHPVLTLFPARRGENQPGPREFRKHPSQVL